MPPFLNDIKGPTVFRNLRFKSDPAAGRDQITNVPPSHTINDRKFEDQHFQQTVQLGNTEEWTLYNDNPGGGGAAHPFHIHINPFQVVAFNSTQDVKNEIQLPAPWVWWDDVAIPVGGYIKMRSRFVDFTGAYVLHCHILGHEDRGMMEMVQVVSNVTTLSHH
jgi:FtsP/CotA-like multicopper oxidase with cupredoxin domain